jgi:hypothetical protein
MVFIIAVTAYYILDIVFNLIKAKYGCGTENQDLYCYIAWMFPAVCNISEGFPNVSYRTSCMHGSTPIWLLYGLGVSGRL